MSDDDIEDTVLHYSDGFEQVLRKTNMSRSSLENKLLDLDVERCTNCREWMSSWSFTNPDTGEIDGCCDNCRKYFESPED
jgi:hypothetical protein